MAAAPASLFKESRELAKSPRSCACRETHQKIQVMKSQTAWDAMEKRNEVAEVRNPVKRSRKERERSAKRPRQVGRRAQTLTNDVGDGEEQSPNGDEEQEANPSHGAPRQG